MRQMIVAGPKMTIICVDDRFSDDSFPEVHSWYQYISNSHKMGFSDLIAILGLCKHPTVTGFRADVKEVILMGRSGYVRYDLHQFSESETGPLDSNRLEYSIISRTQEAMQPQWSRYRDVEVNRSGKSGISFQQRCEVGKFFRHLCQGLCNTARTRVGSLLVVRPDEHGELISRRRMPGSYTALSPVMEILVVLSAAPKMPEWMADIWQETVLDKNSLIFTDAHLRKIRIPGAAAPHEEKPLLQMAAILLEQAAGTLTVTGAGDKSAFCAGFSSYVQNMPLELQPVFPRGRTARAVHRLNTFLHSKKAGAMVILSGTMILGGREHIELRIIADMQLPMRVIEARLDSRILYYFFLLFLDIHI